MLANGTMTRVSPPHKKLDPIIAIRKADSERQIQKGVKSNQRFGITNRTVGHHLLDFLPRRDSILDLLGRFTRMLTSQQILGQVKMHQLITNAGC